MTCKKAATKSWVDGKGGNWDALTSTQKHKAVVRRYAASNVERGNIPRQPCKVCGKEPAEIHHLDYKSKTLNFVWLCEEHHVEAERLKRLQPKPAQIEWTPDPRKRPVLERMADKSMVTDDGCWLWQGYTEHGHGRINHGRKPHWVHRLAWQLLVGPIPDGKWVLHKCVGHGNCWNPAHLYLGDSLKNAQDRVEQKREGNRSGEKNGRAILTIEQIAWIRKHYEPHSRKGMNTVRIAKILGVSQSAVWFVVSNSTWKNPTPLDTSSPIA